MAKLRRHLPVHIYQEDAPVDGTNRLPVTLGLDDPVELTGDVVLDTFGALDDAAVTDPDAASATIPALLRGALATLALDATVDDAVTELEGIRADANDSLSALNAIQSAVDSLDGKFGNPDTDTSSSASISGLLKRIAEGVEALSE